MARSGKIKFQSCIQIFLCILLILSIVQIFPEDAKIIQEVSASSTWEDSNWLAPENYSASKGIDIMPNSGYLKLHSGRVLYVADGYNSRIVKTTMDGSFWTTFGTSGTGVGQFKTPNAIWYDSTGFIYVSDGTNHRIVKTMMDGCGWTTYGSFGAGKGQFNGLGKLSYDNCTGFIYATDGSNNRIVKTKIDGSGWTTYGSFGAGMGQFNGPGGIHYDSITGYIYMTDAYNNRLVKTMIDGTGWTTYGTYGAGKGQFHSPCAIYFDSNTSYIYVADQGNQRIVKTKIDGTGWTTYGTVGSGTGQFFAPVGIHYDRGSEYIYVTDMGNNRIVKTKMNGGGWTTYGTKGSGIGQFIYPNSITLFESSYFSEGYLISKKYNFGSPSDLLTLSWVADTPQDTDVKFQLRSAPNQSVLMTKDFVGPNGSTNTYYKKTGVNIWNGHNSDVWVQYKAYLNTSISSGTPVLKDVKIVYNLLPNQPTLISPPDNVWTNENTITFSWQQNDTDSSAQSAFQWQADDDKEFNHIDYDSKIITSSQSSHTLTKPLPDGFWYWRVRTKDNDGGWGPYSKPWNIQIDTTPPGSKIQFPKDNGFYNKLNIIKGTASDPEVGTRIDKIELNIMRLKDSKYWEGTIWTSKESWITANGTTKWNYSSNSIDWTSGYQYRIYSRGIDNATNYEIPGEGIIFTFDIEKPSSTIITPQNNSFLNRLELISGISSDFDVSGVLKVEILIKQTSDNHYWTGKSWISNETWLKTFGTNDWEFDSRLVKWTSGNQYIIYARATDIVNNVEVPITGTRFVFDTDKPLSNIIHPSAGSYLNHLEMISGNASDHGGSGIERIEITIKPMGKSSYWNGNSWNSDIWWLTVEGKDDWSYNPSQIQWTTDTYYSIRSRATDNADNIQTPGAGTTFMFDNKPPEQSFSINENAEFTNSEIVELSLEYADSGSGVALMAFSNDNVEWSDWEPINPDKIYNLSHGDSEKVVYFRVQDRAGNIAEPVSRFIILDTQPPECSIVINDNAEYTNSNLVSLSLTASDSLSGVSMMAFSFYSRTWPNWKPFNRIESLTLSSGDGEKTVYFRVWDTAGNSAISTDTIILDTIAPHSLIIIINNGATETSSTTVNLKLNALDATSGVDQMSFSEDGITWSPWEDYTKTGSYDLPAGSNKTVIYFRVKDRAGNVAYPEVGSITLNNPRSEIKSDSTDMFWLIILVIIIVIVIAVSVAIILSKRKKQAKETIQTQESAIIVPGDLSSPTITTPQLIAAQTYARPQLQVTTTQTTPTPQIAQVQPLPQLPPATVQPKPTIPTITPIPDNTQLTPPPEPKTEPPPIQGPDEQHAIETENKEINGGG